MTDYVQIGTTALRDPRTGEFLESVPLFVKAEDAGKCQSVVISGEDLARTLADKFGDYLKQSKKSR